MKPRYTNRPRLVWKRLEYAKDVRRELQRFIAWLDRIKTECPYGTETFQGGPRETKSATEANILRRRSK